MKSKFKCKYPSSFKLKNASSIKFNNNISVWEYHASTGRMDGRKNHKDAERNFFYMNGTTSAAGIKFGICRVNRLTCKIAVSLEGNATVFQSKIIIVNVVVSELLERNYCGKR